jgi:hypothetical protein
LFPRQLKISVPRCKAAPLPRTHLDECILLKKEKYKNFASLLNTLLDLSQL